MKILWILAALIASIAAPAAACAPNERGIVAESVWSKATPRRATTAAIYMHLRDCGTAGDRLKAIETPAAERAELHSISMENGVMQMRPVVGADVPAGGSIDLAPGKLHVMLIGLKHPLKEGDVVPMTLIFDNAGRVQVESAVTGLGGPPPPYQHKH